jgi:hypothetical protein
MAGIADPEICLVGPDSGPTGKLERGFETACQPNAHTV